MEDQQNEEDENQHSQQYFKYIKQACQVEEMLKKNMATSLKETQFLNENHSPDMFFGSQPFAIANFLKCPCCKSDFSKDKMQTTPFVLPCGHTFCQNCIQQSPIKECATCHHKFNKKQPVQNDFATQLLEHVTQGFNFYGSIIDDTIVKQEQHENENYGNKNNSEAQLSICSKLDAVFLATQLCNRTIDTISKLNALGRVARLFQYILPEFAIDLFEEANRLRASIEDRVDEYILGNRGAATADAHYHMAKIHARLQNKVASLEDFKKSLSLYFHTDRHDSEAIVEDLQNGLHACDRIIRIYNEDQLYTQTQDMYHKKIKFYDKLLQVDDQADLQGYELKKAATFLSLSELCNSEFLNLPSKMQEYKDYALDELYSSNQLNGLAELDQVEILSRIRGQLILDDEQELGDDDTKINEQEQNTKFNQEDQEEDIDQRNEENEQQQENDLQEQGFYAQLVELINEEIENKTRYIRDQLKKHKSQRHTSKNQI